MKSVLINLSVFLLLISSVYAQSNRIDRGRHEFKISTKVILANGGKALFPIVVAPNSNSEVKKNANTLAQKLQQISGATFVVQEGDGSIGIAVGTQGAFSGLQTSFDISDPREQQGYEIKTHNQGVYIVGATTMGLEYGVFHLLEKIGYRMYFPQERWEIIPKLNKLEIGFHLVETPDYFHRRVWPGFGVWPEFITSSNLWDSVNRNGGYPLKTGHAYNKFVDANKEAFQKHPEYHALINGKRDVDSKLPKLCISNENLRQLIADYAISEFEKDPLLASFSVDPSDGGGWCECTPCLKIGSPSTRATFLANTVASAVRTKFTGKRIGMYAYNLHSAPPQIKVDKDVVVSAATRFIRGGLALNQMIEGWTAQNAILGIREYYDVYIWSKHLPGKSDGGNLDYLKNTITSFYQKGARYLTSESSDALGPNGLGHYLSLKMMWNVDEANNLVALKHDFTKISFGPAASTMLKFYEYLDGANKHLVTEDLVARMYMLIEQARLEAKSHKSIIERIDDIAAYVHFVELFVKFEALNGKKGELEAYNKLSLFIRDSKNHRIIHSLAISKGSHWKKMAPKGAEQVDITVKTNYIPSNKIDSIVKAGIANNKLIDFTPIDFGGDLVLTSHNQNPRYEKGTLAARRGFRTYYTWVNSDLKPIEINVTGGLITHYRDRGNVKVQLINIGGASDSGERETVVQIDTSSVPNGIENRVVLKPKQPGLYAVTFSDGNDSTNEHWLNYNKTFKSEKLVSGTFYAYVPKDTKKLGMFLNTKRGKIIDHKGRTLLDLANVSGYYSVDVSEDQGGKVIGFSNVSGEINLMTIPPYFSLDHTQIMLPSEIVAKDKITIDLSSIIKYAKTSH